MFKAIINENTYLRMFHLNDSNELFELTDRNRNYLKRWLPWLDSIRTPFDTKNFLRNCLMQYGNNDGFQSGIYYNEKLVGTVGTHKIDWINNKTALGYWLGEEYMHKGIMTIAVKKMTDYLFEYYKLNRIEIRAAKDNLESRAIPERLGFVYEGNLRQNEWLYDHFEDNVVYSMLKTEWELQGDRL